jgi:hypothetical protein
VRGRPGVAAGEGRKQKGALFAAIEFLSQQLAIPGENGIGLGEARDWLQAFAS